MSAPKILLTAFEPFMDWKTNSSELCLKKLKKIVDFSTLNIKSSIYPVSWDRARTKLEKDLKGKYDYLVHLGQNELAESIVLEFLGRNQAAGMDVDGEQLKGKIDGNGMNAYQSLIDLAAMRKLLRTKGFPSQKSDNAGKFLCNFVYYLSMQSCAKTGKGKCAFLHIPLDPSQTAGTTLNNPTYDVNKSAEAVAIILKKLSHG